ncbi:F-box protein SKIP23-like [Argentina anserina]|uniref:F-box protein SKIP23-like n=1 Tax=Argentina anserina TaxID=57926 RepID=UPI00217655E1|nr:F-box protein SKIP23-like [Potentilla anserina]
MEPTMMAERHIPDELTEIILKHLDLKNEIHVKQFRAVCQSWRSSIPPCKPALAIGLPSYCLWPESPSRFYEIKETVVYHVVPPPPADGAGERKRGWLIRLYREFPHPEELPKPKLIPAILPPSSRWPLPTFRPKSMSFLDCGISELTVHYFLGRYGGKELYKLISVSLNLDAVMTLRDGILCHGTFSTANLRAVNLVKYDDEPVDDAIFYQGKFYAVSRNGCAFVGRGCCIDYMLKTEVKFKVYKLDPIRKHWVAMKASNLNDRILFVGEDCCFSVSTRDFPGCPGSSIYFCYEYEKWGCHEICSGIGVFNLENGRGLRLEDYPPGANILMPPPS